MSLVWAIIMIFGLVILIIAISIIGWLSWIFRSRRPRGSGFEYIMVTKDGGAREVTLDEREDLEYSYSPADGARPYIKFRYESLDGWKSLEGFLLRRKLPKAIQIEQENQS